MDRIAFIYGETFVYWSSIVLTLAAVTAICFFLAFYLGKSGNAVGAAVLVPLALVASLVLGRLVHWYSRGDSYDSFEAAMTGYGSGGYALVGVIAGCVAAALLLRLLYIVRNLPELLDCMALGGAAGIAVGRLASFFNGSDRGQILESVRELPWVYPVTNAVSGELEYRLATFLLQSMAAAAIFAVLALVFLIGHGRKKLRDGDVALLFLLFYGAAQAVLDSTRYDSLFLRSNGFVSIVQILSAAAVVLVAVVFSARMVKARRLRFWQLILWFFMLAGLGCAGYMEYYVQRHGDRAAFAYSVMSGALAAVVLLVLLVRKLGQTRRILTERDLGQ